MLYAREAAEFSTEYQMMDMEFAVNHYGQPDVAMFDFTSMYAAENASRILERHGYRLLMILVGDSLLEVNDMYFLQSFEIQYLNLDFNVACFIWSLMKN